MSTIDEHQPKKPHHADQVLSPAEDEAYRWLSEGAPPKDQNRRQELPKEEPHTAGTWFGTMTDDQSTEATVRKNQEHARYQSVLLFGLFFLLGFAALVAIVFGFILPEWRANNRYLSSSCVVLDKRVSMATKLSPRTKGGTHYPEIKISYQVDGQTYDVWAYEAVTAIRSEASARAIVDSFQVGGTYACWYDPDRPDKAILVRGYSWPHYYLVLIPIVFLSIGANGLYRWWKYCLYVRTWRASRRG
jgi:hypothetical protein